MWLEEDNLFGVEGYEVRTTRHAGALIREEFPLALDELSTVLGEFTIQEIETIRSGGGEASITQRLRRALSTDPFLWRKKNVQSVNVVDGEERFSESHEIDHFKSFDKGSIGLEIEWNNKDPFYDRDLGTFRSLHAVDAISLGIIITRGYTLQDELHEVFIRHFENMGDYDVNDLLITATQKRAIEKSIHGGMTVPQATAKKLYNDKFGEATTHMRKLQARIERGLGNPCPLILIGIGSERMVE